MGNKQPLIKLYAIHHLQYEFCTTIIDILFGEQSRTLEFSWVSYPTINYAKPHHYFILINF